MKDLLFSLFEYAATFFEGFLIVSFLFDYCGYRHHNGWGKIASRLLCQFILSFMIVISNKITSFESIGVFLYAVALFIMAMLFLEGSIIQKIFVSVFPILCNVIIAAVTMTIVAAVSEKALSEIYSTFSIPRAIGVVATKIELLLILQAVLSPARKKQDMLLTNAEWVQVILVAVSSMLIIDTTLNFQLHYIKFPMSNGVVLVILCVLSLDLYLLYVILKINRYNRIRQENELLKQQHMFHTKYAESVQQQYDEVRALRHDWKHCLSALSMLLGEEKFDEARSFINKYSDIVEAPNSYIRTENELLDAIINSKLSQTYQYKIKTSCAVSSSCKQIDGIDLCNLLGNLLDNAIEASLKVPNSEAAIVLKIWGETEKTMIFVKNTIAESVLKSNPILRTNKPIKNRHGIGMKTIKSIVDRYNGLIDIYEEDDSFCILVTLFTTNSQRASLI